MGIRGELAKVGINTFGAGISIPTFTENLGRGKTLWLDGANGSASYAGRDAKSAFVSLSTAYAALTTGVNDKINFLASTSAINLASKLTWAKNLCHLVGEGSYGMMNQRSRIGHSANFATLIDVTGYGNSFHNLYFMYGRGSATNTNLLTVTGDRNSFYNCHFGGPMHATEGATASFNLVTIYGTENYFKNCTFGISTIDVAAAIQAVVFGGSGYDPRTIFDDCTFIFRGAAGGASSTFIKTVSGVGEAFILFRGNTMFLNVGGTAFTLAIDGAGSAAQKIYFATQPTIVNCTDVIAAASEGNVFLPSATYIAAATANGLAVNPDHTA